MVKKFLICDEDYTGLVGAMLEANMSWNAIEMQCMSEEAHLILEAEALGSSELAATNNSSRSLARSSSETSSSSSSSDSKKGFLDKSKELAKKFFTAIIQWFKDLWNKIVELLGNLKNRISTMFMKNEKYFTLLDRKLDNWPGRTLDTKVTMHKWDPELDVIGFCSLGSEISNKIHSAKNIESIEEGLKSILGGKDPEEIIKSRIFKDDGSNTVQIEIDKSRAQKAGDFCISAKSIINGINKQVSTLKSEINDGTKASQQGLKEASSNNSGSISDKVKTSFNEHKRIATSKKNACILVSKIMNITIKYILMRYSEEMKIINAAIGGMKKDAKDDAKAKKDAAKSIKNDSLFLNFNNNYNLYSEDVTDVLGESFLLDFDEM